MSTFIAGRGFLLGAAISMCSQAGLAITIDQVSLQVDLGHGEGLQTVTSFPTKSELQAQEGKRFDFDLTDYGYGKTFAKGQAEGFISFSENDTSAILSKGLSITATKPQDDLALSLDIEGHYFTTLPIITEEESIGGLLQNGFFLPGGGASRVGYDLGLVPFIGHKSVDVRENLLNSSVIPVVDGIPPKTMILPVGTRIDFTDVLYVNAQLAGIALGDDFARSDFYETTTEQLTEVPEPATVSLLVAGLVAVLAWRRLRDTDRARVAPTRVEREA